MHTKVDIYVDSQAALLALANVNIKSQLVLDTVQLLNDAGIGNSITLHWIKAHAGHPGNERVDLLAKMGAQNLSMERICPAPPSSLIKSLIKEKMHLHWSVIWNERADCRQTKLWFPTVDQNKSNQVLQLNRVEISRMVQIITGHDYLKRHISLVQGTGDDICRLCEEDEESSSHVVTECPALALARFKTLGTPHQVAPQDWSIKQVTSFLREASIGDLWD